MYKGGRGKVQVQVIFDTNTFWLSQQRMAELFGVTVPTINYHLDQMVWRGDDVQPRCSHCRWLSSKQL